MAKIVVVASKAQNDQTRIDNVKIAVSERASHKNFKKDEA